MPGDTLSLAQVPAGSGHRLFLAGSDHSVFVRLFACMKGLSSL